MRDISLGNPIALAMLVVFPAAATGEPVPHLFGPSHLLSMNEPASSQGLFPVSGRWDGPVVAVRNITKTPRALSAVRAKYGAEYPLPNLLDHLGGWKIKTQWDRCGGLLCQSNRIARTLVGPKRRRVFSNIERRAGMMDANRIEECDEGSNHRKEANPRHTA
jgi:hypothetical protein